MDVSGDINPLACLFVLHERPCFRLQAALRTSTCQVGSAGKRPASGQSPALQLHHRGQRRRGEWNRRQGAATWRWQQHRHGDAHPWERHIHTSLCTQRRSFSLVNRLAPTTHRTPSAELSRVDFTDREWFLVCVFVFVFRGFASVLLFHFFLMVQSSDSVSHKGTAYN